MEKCSEWAIAAQAGSDLSTLPTYDCYTDLLNLYRNTIDAQVLSPELASISGLTERLCAVPQSHIFFGALVALWG